MGAQIIDLAKEDSEFKVAAQISSAKSWALDARAIDVVIEFTDPSGCAQALNWCVKHKKPLVSGTTGLSEKDGAALKTAARKIPLLHSANMSLGIAVMSAMLDSLGTLKDWDFQIEEVHHRRKKDAPSGTALMLDQRLAQAIGQKLPRPNSVRGGGVPGIHQIWAMGEDEVLTLQHTAFNRKVFARGALQAARWLFDKKQPGLYDLSDLYKMRS
jgi:4-hydroxy-tetrahydrodipicolinate reductase